MTKKTSNAFEKAIEKILAFQVPPRKTKKRKSDQAKKGRSQPQQRMLDGDDHASSRE